MKELSFIKSNKIKSISEHLYNDGNRVTFFGKAWSKPKGNWIYFNTVLDLEFLIKQFDIDNKLEIIENTDPKSGTEKGLFDKNTEEAVMGYLK